MKTTAWYFIAVLSIILLLCSCKSNKEKVVMKTETREGIKDTSLIVIAKDIITEVILSRVPDGDPWEAEKIQGYDGREMTDKLFDDIYSGRLIVYDHFTGLELTPREVKAIENELKPDRYAIGKVQFTEDWYLDTSTDEIIKRVSAVSFGTELKEPTGNIYGYKPIFQIKYKDQAQQHPIN